jgi:hypothetical protein
MEQKRVQAGHTLRGSATAECRARFGYAGAAGPPLLGLPAHELVGAFEDHALIVVR